MVKPKNNGEITHLETVYCSFKQPDGVFHSSGNEERLAHVKLGTSSGTGIYFYVTMKNPFTNTTNMAIIKFDDEQLNIGGAYDLKSGSFAAPKPGIYQFFFAGVIGNPELSNNALSLIFLYRNDDVSPVIGTMKQESEKQKLIRPRDPVFQATIQLKRGEKIQLKSVLPKGSSLILCSFSGSLLEELHE